MECIVASINTDTIVDRADRMNLKLTGEEVAKILDDHEYEVRQAGVNAMQEALERILHCQKRGKNHLQRTYLGDGVYVEPALNYFPEGSIVLTTRDCDGEVTNVIVLEPEVQAALLKYIRPADTPAEAACRFAEEVK